MKDPRRPDVLDARLERSDAPVVTSVVSTGRTAPAAVAVESIVEEAFETIARRLKAFARAAVRDDTAADDLVQETFLRLVREVRECGAPDNIGGWLYRVCANLIASRGRRRSVAERMRSLLVIRGAAPAPDVDVERADEAARLRTALAELPANARVALLMAAEGYTAAEIGSAIGRTAGATATYICRVRVRLRERLGADEDRG